MSRALRPVERLQRGLAAVGDDRAVAEFRHGAFEQPALHGIVVDDEDGSCHAVFSDIVEKFGNMSSGSSWHRVLNKALGKPVNDFLARSAGGLLSITEGIDDAMKSARKRLATAAATRYRTSAWATCRNGTSPISIPAWTLPS